MQLLQKQETLHRLELQKWHDLLMAALRVLRKVSNYVYCSLVMLITFLMHCFLDSQAESDLEVLRTHVTNYSEEKLMPTTYTIAENTKSEDFVQQPQENAPT